MSFAFKFVSANDFGQIDFKQSSLLSFKLRNRFVQSLATSLKSLRQPLAGMSTFQFMGDASWIGQNMTKILPDKFIQLLDRCIPCDASFAFGFA